MKEGVKQWNTCNDVASVSYSIDWIDLSAIWEMCLNFNLEVNKSVCM